MSLDCFYLTPTNNKKSKLYEDLKEVTKNETLSELEYNRVLTPEFKEWFSSEFDWTEDYGKDGSPLPIEMVDENGEPKLHYDKSVGHYYESLTKERKYISSAKFADFSSENLKHVIGEISYFIVESSQKENVEIKDRLTALDSSIKDYILRYIDHKKKIYANNKTALARLDLLQRGNNLFDLTETVKLFFEQRSVSLTEESEVKDDLEVYNNDLNIADSTTINSKDRASANIKILMSFIPKINEDYELVKNSYLGGGVYESYDKLWSVVEPALADLVPNKAIGEDGKEVINDLYSQYIARLGELTAQFPTLNALIFTLEKSSEQTKKQFVQAFYKNRLDFVDSVSIENEYVNEYGDTETTRSYKVMNSEQNTVGKRVMDTWTNSLIFDSSLVDLNSKDLKNVTLSDGTRVPFNKFIAARFQEFANEVLVSNDIDRVDTEDRKSHMTQLLDFLFDIGITNDFKDNLSEDVIDTLIDQISEGNTQQDRVNAWKELVGGNKDSFINLFRELGKATRNTIFTKSSQKNPLLNQKLFKKIADVEGARNPEASETTVLTKNGKAWLFDLPNFLNVTLALAKSGEIGEFKKRLEDRPYYANSRWLLDIVEAVETQDTKFLDNLSIKVFNTFRKSDNKKSLKDNKTITFEEQFADSIEKTFIDNPIFNMLEPADKGRFQQIQGFKRHDANIRTNKEGKTEIVSEDTIEIFYKYFLDEYHRIREHQVERTAKVKELDDAYSEAFDKKGANHPDTIEAKEAKKIGFVGIKGYRDNAENFTMFDFISDNESIMDTFKGEEGVYQAHISAEASELIKEEIKEALTSQVEEGVQKLKDSKIWNSLSDNIKRIGRSNNQLNPEAYIMGNYVINGLIANIEMTKVFTGDPAYYKTLIDFKKRVPATYTNGLHLDLSDIKDLKYNVAILNDSERGSDYLYPRDKDKRDKYVKEVVEATGYKESDVRSILKDYDKLDRTDAQAYITPERWAFILDKLGKFGDKERAAYDNLINGKESIEDVKLIAQPLKGVYFSVENGKPTYLKYSQAVLLPSLANGTQLEALANRMKEDKVDEAVFVSGTKVGAEKINTVHNDNGDLVITSPLQSIQLDNRFWKLQQDLPSKGVKDTALGSQIQKNILANFVLDGTYNYNGKPVDGIKLLSILDETVKTLSNNGARKVEKRFFTEEGNINTDNVRESIINELTRNGQDENLLQALKKGLPYDALASYKEKIQSVFFSSITKNTVKIKTSGGSFIQMANFGLDRLTNSERSGITWIKSDTELKPPRVENGKVKKGQILLPHSAVAKAIPNYQSLSKEQLLRMIDKRLLNVIGYRIPNQGMSSNDALEVVGILPPEVGDTIVGYPEITKKTGSDFDIDKMYVMMPAFKKVFSSDYEHIQKFIKGQDKKLIRLLNKTGLYEKIDFNNKANLINVLDSLINSENTIEDKDLLDILESFDLFIQENPKTVKKLEYIDHNGTSDKALQNRLIHIYESILTDTKSYMGLITSIDRTTKLVKDDINQNSENTTSKSGLDHFDPVQELEAKRGLSEGKNGVGITANQLVDHVIAQNFPLKLLTNIGFGHSYGKTTSFNEVQDKNKEQNITDVISAFLNAFVDIAKDPYILRGNYNNFTTNTAFFLIRAGTPYKEVNAFIGQPSLKKYFEYDNLKNSSLSEDFKEEETGKYVDIKEKIKKETAALSPNSKEIEKLSLADLQSKYLSLEQMKTSLQKGDPDVSYAALLYFIKVQPHVASLDNIVKATKSDVQGATSSAYAREAFVNSYEKANENEMWSGVTARFDNTRFGAFYNNSVGLAGEISSKLFLEETPGVRALRKSALEQFGIEQSSNKETIKAISKDISTYALSTTAFFSENKKDLLSTLGTTLLELKSKSDNPFLKSLTVDLQDNIKFIKADSIRNKSDYLKNSLYKGWLDLLTSKDPKEKQFGNDLIRYSYLTSGFQHGIGSFYSSIPHDWLGWEKVDFRLDNILKENQVGQSPFDVSNFIEQFAKHNSDNATFVKNANKVVMSPFKKGYNKTQVFLLNTKKVNPNFAISVDPFTGLTTYPPFVTIKDPKLGNLLYKQVALDLDSTPIYIQINKLGYNDNGKRIFEYSIMPKKSSLLKKNNSNILNESTFLKDNPELEGPGYVAPKESEENTRNSQENVVPLQQSSEMEVSEKDLSFKKGKLETFTLSNKEEVKGTSILIEGQPNVDLFAYRVKGAGWTIIDNKSKSRFPLSSLFDGFAGTRGEVLEALHKDIEKYSKEESSKKMLESIGFNFGKPTQQSSEVENSFTPTSETEDMVNDFTNVSITSVEDSFNYDDVSDKDAKDREENC